MRGLDPDDPAEVGPYVLTGRLGEGGMGRVYQGRSPGGRLVAVKVARRDLAADTAFRSRFRSEVEAARRVGGFHTAQVVDADPDADPPWMVTAFVQGRTLDVAIAQDGPMDEDGLRALAAALAEALGAIHACGLVHRDLKPSNIIMSGDGPRVVDFGIARALDETRLTQTSVVVGTAGFLAPEQISGGVIGPACDVFALGAVLVHAAGGRAFGEGGHLGLMYRAVHDEPDLTAVPGPLRRLVEACLAKAPADRPEPAGLLEALGPVASAPVASAPAAGRPAASDAGVVAQEGGAEAAPARPAPPAVTVPATAVDRRRPEARAGGAGLQEAMFTTPRRNRAAVALTWAALAGICSYAAFAMTLTHETAATVLVLLPWLCAPLFAAVIAWQPAALQMNASGLIVHQQTLNGRRGARIAWQHLAGVDVIPFGPQRLPVLRLTFVDGAPLPFDLDPDAWQATALDVPLPRKVTCTGSDGSPARPRRPDPDALKQTAEEAVRHFAPHTLPRRRKKRPTVERDLPERLQLAVPRSHRKAAAVAWLVAAAGFAWWFYLRTQSGETEDGWDALWLVVPALGAIACLVRLAQALFFEQSVAFDADGITVRSLGTGAWFIVESQLIPWADVSALSPASPGSAMVRVHLRSGRPLPRPQRGLARHTETRVDLDLSAGGTRGSIERRRLIAAVRHFAPHVDTGQL
ncbi:MULTISPECIES: protein kinase domain-containing protein [unclassified Streptomyces]|uniref:serine/threonine-protein kinase n=1 Tax=unclassified Streptomyces TaxID=2593676 RepID=UPI0028869314|nr:serine/threonine-protein kinase [Streptomyces sp. DSM 41633]